MFTLMELVQPASIDEAYEILMKRKNNQIIGGSAFLRMGKKTQKERGIPTIGRM